MKTFKTLAVIFVLFAAITSLHADDKIKIKIKQPPPNMLGVGDMWNLTLENTTKSDLKIYLTGTATEEKDGLIIEGKSKVFTIKPGRSTYKYNDFSGAEVKYNNGKYKEIILRTGNAPEGSYTMCVTAFDESGNEVGRENCIMQQVQQLGSITLISPQDNIELDPDTLPGLMFSWAPLPKGGPYSLRIVELKGDQSPDVAIRENRPILDKSGITTTSLQYPLSEKKLEAGKKYAWQVSSGEVVSDVRIIKGPPINPTDPNEPLEGVINFQPEFIMLELKTENVYTNRETSFPAFLVLSKILFDKPVNKNNQTKSVDINFPDMLVFYNNPNYSDPDRTFIRKIYTVGNNNSVNSLIASIKMTAEKTDKNYYTLMLTREQDYIEYFNFNSYSLSEETNVTIEGIKMKKGGGKNPFGSGDPLKGLNVSKSPKCGGHAIAFKPNSDGIREVSFAYIPPSVSDSSNLTQNIKDKYDLLKEISKNGYGNTAVNDLLVNANFSIICPAVSVGLFDENYLGFVTIVNLPGHGLANIYIWGSYQTSGGWQTRGQTIGPPCFTASGCP